MAEATPPNRMPYFLPMPQHRGSDTQTMSNAAITAADPVPAYTLAMNSSQ